MIYVGLHISDIHLNPNNFERILNEMKEEFIYRVDVYSKLDYITINGDLLDYELSLNSPVSRAVISFMDELVNICIDKNIALRIIKGTQFHDNNQLRIFLKYENRSELNFKLIERVYEEELFPEFNVLYVPEEYVKNVDEYYRPYMKENHYNAIFGHGMFKETSFTASKQESGVTMHSAPTFDSTVFRRICKGFVVFGHIHTPTIIKNFIYYTGSFSSLNFGEEHKKGFTLSSYDTDTDNFIIEFVENKLAPKYKTIVINELENIDDISDFIYKLDDVECDKLRLIVNFKNVNDLEKSNLEILKSFMNRHKKFTLLIKNVGLESRREREKEESTEMSSKYRFLTEEGLPMENKIVEFIKVKYDLEFDVERVKKHMDI